MFFLFCRRAATGKSGRIRSSRSHTHQQHGDNSGPLSRLHPSFLFPSLSLPLARPFWPPTTVLSSASQPSKTSSAAEAKSHDPGEAGRVCLHSLGLIQHSRLEIDLVKCDPPPTGAPVHQIFSCSCPPVPVRPLPASEPAAAAAAAAGFPRSLQLEENVVRLTALFCRRCVLNFVGRDCSVTSRQQHISSKVRCAQNA